MQKDTKLKPDEPLLWADLGAGQKGLKQYDQAIASYQKGLSLEQASKKPNPEILGSVQSGLGECYARTGKVPEANAAFAAAAKDDPAGPRRITAIRLSSSSRSTTGPRRLPRQIRALRPPPTCLTLTRPCSITSRARASCRT